MTSGRPIRAWAAVIVFLGFAAIAVQLGFWQLGRADEKQAMIDLRAGRKTPAALGSPEQPWKNGMSAQDLDQQRVVLTGKWMHSESIALDNRAWEGRAGVHVLSPLVLPDASRVWVNRGWMPKLPGVNQVAIPAANDAIRLEGLALASVMKRMELGKQGPGLSADNVWQNFDWQASQRRIGGDRVWPVIVWQITETPDGLLRRLPEVEDDVSKHLGYAVQWFLICLACLFFAFRLRPRRTKSAGTLN
ncbi:MAG: SURF1 family protein [Betaproteobacteria bacterium]|nr:SURF1 family protein [Betaproteobacteria bacterium]